jgi:hypothetical protein
MGRRRTRHRRLRRSIHRPPAQARSLSLQDQPLRLPLPPRYQAYRETSPAGPLAAGPVGSSSRAGSRPPREPPATPHLPGVLGVVALPTGVLPVPHNDGSESPASCLLPSLRSSLATGASATRSRRPAPRHPGNLPAASAKFAASPRSGRARCGSTHAKLLPRSRRESRS